MNCSPGKGRYLRGGSLSGELVGREAGNGLANEECHIRGGTPVRVLRGAVLPRCGPRDVSGDVPLDGVEEVELILARRLQDVVDRHSEIHPATLAPGINPLLGPLGPVPPQ